MCSCTTPPSRGPATGPWSKDSRWSSTCKRVRRVFRQRPSAPSDGLKQRRDAPRPRAARCAPSLRADQGTWIVFDGASDPEVLTVAPVPVGGGGAQPTPVELPATAAAAPEHAPEPAPAAAPAVTGPRLALVDAWASGGGGGGGLAGGGGLGGGLPPP